MSGNNNKTDHKVFDSDTAAEISHIQFSPPNYTEELLFSSHWDATVNLIIFNFS